MTYNCSKSTVNNNIYSYFRLKKSVIPYRHIQGEMMASIFYSENWIMRCQNDITDHRHSKLICNHNMGRGSNDNISKLPTLVGIQRNYLIFILKNYFFLKEQSKLLHAEDIRTVVIIISILIRYCINK